MLNPKVEPAGILPAVPNLPGQNNLIKTQGDSKGELALHLGVKNGKTIISDVYNKAPLKIAKPFYLDPPSGELFIYQMNPGGGMLQGDVYRVEVEMEPGSGLFMSTQSAAKIYRTPQGQAAQYNLFRLGPDCLLEYFPDPVIPFAGSKFSGDTEVYLAKGCTAFWAEIVTPGRIRRDEAFQYDYYRSRTRVYWEEELILWDNWCQEPRHKDIASLGICEGFTHQGNLFIFSEKASQGLADSLHEKLLEQKNVMGSASLTAKNGIALRLLGKRADQVEEAVKGCWDLARRELIGLSRPYVRKY